MNHKQPAWRESLEALLANHAHLPFSRFVQVATIREDGRPANRTLTFRFFLKDSCLMFTADTRTEKIAQLTINPWAELCWYFVEARVQMRLLGTMRHIKECEDEESAQAFERTWHERTEESRQSFTWPTAGLPLSAPPSFLQPATERPPATFGLLRFTPDRVETLDLSCKPHSRELHILKTGEWQSSRINP